jgi:hypothetical protein
MSMPEVIPGNEKIPYNSNQYTLATSSVDPKFFFFFASGYSFDINLGFLSGMLSTGILIANFNFFVLKEVSLHHEG